MVNRYVDALDDLVASERLGAAISVVAGPHLGRRAVLDAAKGIIAGDLPGDIEAAAVDAARRLMEREHNATVDAGGSRVFIETLAPRPHLVIFGAVDIARSLCRFATDAGFRVTVTDARPAFCTAERFPDAAAVIAGWPEDVAADLGLDERTFVVTLSHSARLEDPAIQAALRARVRYLGAMGSRGTHAKRRDRLFAAGFEPAVVDAIHAPVGLGIGAESPSEVAISILAELIAARHGAGGTALAHGEGPIHPQRVP